MGRYGENVQAGKYRFFESMFSLGKVKDLPSVSVEAKKVKAFSTVFSLKKVTSPFISQKTNP